MSWSSHKSGKVKEVREQVAQDLAAADSQLTGAEKSIKDSAAVVLDEVLEVNESNDPDMEVKVDAAGHFDGKKQHLSIVVQ